MPRTISITFTVLRLSSLFFSGGESPGNPSVENNIVAGNNVLEGASHYVKKNLSCLHAARSAFIQAESSERIKRALSKNTRQTVQVFNRATMFSIGRIVFFLDQLRFLARSPVLFLSDMVGHL